jgi:hypothetical protein
MKPRLDRMCALADSLPAAVRWRFCDYEQLLKKELQLLAAPSTRLIEPPRRRRAALK